jgi:predicted enzyme related to lactoylglutathione lyase
MANLVVHFEIHASEPQKLIDYYSRLLGWTFQDYGGGDQPYWIIGTGEGSIVNASQPGLGINGGMTQRQGPRPEVGAPVNGCNIVVGVDDVDGLMRRGVELGGTEALPAADWPGIGRGGYLLDPDGNLFGLISPVMSDGTVAMGAGSGD